MLQTLNKIKKDTLALVGNKFDKDFRFDKNLEVRIILKNSYIIDPKSVDEYIARDGYFSVQKALFDMKPAEVTALVKRVDLKAVLVGDSQQVLSGDSYLKTMTKNTLYVMPMKVNLQLLSMVY